MLKSISTHKKDGKGKVKSNFVTLYLAFKGSIPTIFYFIFLDNFFSLSLSHLFCLSSCVIS